MASKPTVEDMVKWFLANYKDPAHGVPHESAEGGYQYIHGGPYDASDEIEEQFPEADSDDIKKAVKEVERGGLLEWVKDSEY